MFVLDHAARLYDVPVIDYGFERGNGLLIGSGSGLMMAIMDAAPRLRWCVDIDGLGPGARLGDFLLIAERCVDPIAVAGWFSITDPAPLRAALAALSEEPLVYSGHIELGAGRQMSSVRELLDALRAEGEHASACRP